MSEDDPAAMAGRPADADHPADADVPTPAGADASGDDEAAAHASDDATADDGVPPAAPARPAPPDDGRGDAIIKASWGGTGIYVLVAVAELVAVQLFQLPMIIVCVGLFGVGLFAFAAAYMIAISRSREVEIGMGGLYFLAGTAPRRVQRHLMGSFAVEILVATVTASLGLALVPADANNPLAYGFLVPLYGLGLAGLWGARYGTFGPRRSATDSGAAAHTD